MSFGHIYIYSGTPLARPPAGRHLIGRVRGLVASDMHSKGFIYYRDNFISTILSLIKSYSAFPYVLLWPMVTVL